MSFANPANRITRWSVVGMEGMWTKMWDPPTTSPAATDQLLLVPQGQIRPNPVPEVMFAAGHQLAPSVPHTVQRSLLLNLSVPTWDGAKTLTFFTIGDPDNAAAGGTYPGPTLRMPRGVIFNAQTVGKGPPPHTIHWHGIEPTPLNDGVGHCSMEIGRYTYQWQPNFMGFYFLHCHRNTVQHFEYGLFSAMIFEAPDAYFGSIASTDPVTGAVTLKDLNQFPIGGGRDGKRRCACNLANFPQFLGFNSNPVDAPDPGPGPTDTQISFATDPHAMTVPFDVESLMVFDDRDSVWSDLAPGAHTTFPAHGPHPGFDDNFARNPGALGFAAFNDYNADYWFVTGVPVPARKGGTAAIGNNIVIPPALNSGISGTQVSINAQTDQTILVRILDAAYNCLRVTFPVNAVIIAWDGRALGVAPFGHNEAYLVPAGTPIDMTVARRFDALIKSHTPFTGNIKAEFINHQSQTPGDIEEVVMTALVPINIGGVVAPAPVFPIKGKVLDQVGAPVAGVTMTVTSTGLTGTALQKVITAADGTFTASVINGTYEVTPTLAGHTVKTDAGAPLATVSVNDQVLTVPNFTASIASFGPNSYTLNEAIDSLRSVVGIKTPTPVEKFRFDVSPIFNGIPAPDGVLDVRDSLNILRMVVGLNPV